MQLTDFLFLFGFLPAALFVWLAARRSARAANAALLFLSLLFCALGGLGGFFAAALETLFVYVLARLLAGSENARTRKRLFALGVFVCLGLLCYFKYTNFFLKTFGLPQIRLLPAPVGVSFLTFLLISYLADVYRERIPAERRLERLALYAFFFPKAAQGPLCRYESFSSQLGAREDAAPAWEEGVTRLIVGLGKKALLASAAGAVAQEAFALPAAALAPVYAWTGAICYALQIYFDFSGYTDMAIGLALLFGIRLPENFSAPYTAVSVSDFWRRWHISLSSWFRDYVYIPLGGSRCSKGRMVLNLFAVWSLTGLWHGANWTFLAWGVWFFLLLTAEKLWLGKRLAKLPRALAHGYALLAVLIGWIFFNSPSLSYAFSFLRALLVSGEGAPDAGAWLMLCLRQYGAQLALCVLLCTNFGAWLGRTLEKTAAARAVKRVLLLAVFGLSVLHIAASGMQAFIYAQF